MQSSELCIFEEHSNAVCKVKTYEIWQDMTNICSTSFTCQLANAVSVDFSWLAAIVVDKVRTQKVENHRGSYLENIELFSNFYDFKLKSMNFRHLIMNVQKIG